MAQIPPALAKMIAELREELQHPDNVFVLIKVRGGGSYRLWSEDVIGKSDQEVAELLMEKYLKHSKPNYKGPA